MESPSSLWLIAETTFFPRRVKIRSQLTRKHYRYAIESFGEFLGRPAVLADLDDDTVTGWLGSMLDQDKSPSTSRGKLSRILALWRFLAARRIVDKWPTVDRPEVPEPSPIALSPEQLRALFAACETMGGRVCGIPACRWWRSYLAFIWNSSERRGAALAVRYEWIDWERGVVQIPANVRKGKRKPAVYMLWPETLQLMQTIRLPERELFWPWDRCPATYFYQFGRLLTMAGIPNDRKHKTHSLRVSHATYRHALGHDASRALMHSDPATTRRHYIDSSTLPQPAPLFIPWAG
jgi:integrase